MEPSEDNNPALASEVEDARWSGLRNRTFSAIILGIIGFFVVWKGGMLFAAFVLLAALIMKKEWDLLDVRQTSVSRLTGYVYVILPCASLLWLRFIPGAGLGATAALILVIAATDIGAYFVGKRFGKHRLAPAISPGKTWEGLAGGFFAAIFTGLLVSGYVVGVQHNFMGTVWTSGLIALLAQAGDLYESSLKRKANVKDSGTILPGHGGLLDRLDGYMLTAPVYAFLVDLALP